MEVRIIKYKITQDFEKMLAAKDCQHKAKVKSLNEEFQRNKERLLPYVLQMIESAYIVHNMRCNRVNNTTTGFDGIFGISQVDIKKQLNYAITDSNNIWLDNGATFVWYFGSRGSNVKIWLNDRVGSHVATPQNEYSMNRILKHSGGAYGASIESEIESLIELLANKFHDEW